MKKKGKVLALLLATAMIGTSFDGSSLVGYAKTTSKAKEAEASDSSKQESVVASNGMYTDPTDKEHATGDSKELEERQQKLEKQITSDIKTDDFDNEQSFPAAVDNSTNENAKYFPPIGDQGLIGSCAYWADYYYAGTYQYNKFMGTAASESTTFSPRWYYINGEFASDDQIHFGMTIDRCPIDTFSKLNGSEFPADCESDWLKAQSISATGEECYYVGKYLIDQWKEYLTEGNVFSVVTFPYWYNYINIDGDLCSENKKFDGEQAVVADMGMEGSDSGYHAITVVGYDDDIELDLNGDGIIEEGEKGAFKIANSWGTSWGNDGYMWIAYDALNGSSNYISTPNGYRRKRAISGSCVFRMETQEKKDTPRYYVTVTAESDKSGLVIRVDDLNGKFCRTSRGSHHQKNYAGESSGVVEFGQTAAVASLENLDYITIMNESQDGDITVKDVQVVDTVKKVTYDLLDSTVVLNSENSELKLQYHDKTYPIAPYFSEFSLQNDSSQAMVKGKVTAIDTAGKITYKASYTCEDQKDTGTIAVSSNGNFTFIPEKYGTYRVKVVATDSKGNVSKREKTVVVEDTRLDKLEFTSSVASPVAYVKTGDVTLTANARFGSGSYSYRFGVIRSAEEYYANEQFNSVNHITLKELIDKTVFSDDGLILFVDVKDNKTNEIVRKKIKNYVVTGGKIAGIQVKSKDNSFEAGKPLTLSAKLKDHGKIENCSCYFDIALNDVVIEQVHASSISDTEMSVEWTPTKAGTYKFSAVVSGLIGSFKMARKTVRIKRATIPTATPTGDTATVYYKNNNFSNAYIHYKVGNGGWTNVPGIKMSTSDRSDHTWMYTIDLGTNDTATVCFNNGSGNWDSKNGTNYTVKAGKYGISNEQVYELPQVTATPITTPTVTPTVTPTTTPTITPTVTPTTTPTVTPTIAPTQETNVYFDNTNAKWNNVYAYVWTDGASADVLDTTKVADDIYKVSVPSKYKKIIFKNTSSGWDKQTIDLLIPTDSNNCWKPNGSSNKSSGNWYAYREQNEFSVDVVLYGKKGNVNAKAVVSNGTAPYTFSFVDSKDGEVRTPIKGDTPYDYYYHTLSAYFGGHYGTTVTVTDAEGKVATATTSIQIDPLCITSITPDVTPGIVGQKVSFHATYENEFFYKFPNTGTWSIKDAKGNIVSNSFEFTPEFPGTYYVTYTLTDAAPETATKTIEYTVKDNKSNYATVYYNGSWNNAYIHYRVNNGSWTNVPGVEMKSSDRSDYKWMYTIDLEEQTGVTLCFNNGNGSWDSNNGSNYSLGVGTYGVKNGKINKLDEVVPTPTAIPTTVPTASPTTAPTITPTIVPTATPVEQSYVTVSYNNAVTNWSNVYAYVWNTTQDPIVYTPAYKSGKEYVFNITGKYTYIIFKNTKDTWEQQTADLKLPAYTTDYTDKCFTPTSAQKGTNGSWGKSTVLKERNSIVPSVVAAKTTISVDDTVSFIMKSVYENGNYKNSRSLHFTYEDGTTETLYSSEVNSYTDIFTKTGTYTYTTDWKPKKTGKVIVTYEVSMYEDHGEESQPIILMVK